MVCFKGNEKLEALGGGFNIERGRVREEVRGGSPPSLSVCVYVRARMCACLSVCTLAKPCKIHASIACAVSVK